MRLLRGKLFWPAFLLVAALSLVAVWVTALRPGKSAREQPAPAVDFAANQGIACLGRIEPEDGIIKIAVRGISGQPSIVGELKVREGDYVEAGVILANLNCKEQLEDTWRESEARVKVAQMRLAQAKTGAKAGDLAAQRAEIARLETELADAEAQHRRNTELHRRDIIPTSALDRSHLLLETKSHLLKQAKERLGSLTEVRQADVDVAAAEVEHAIAAERRARAELKESSIRSPAAGKVIRIHSWPGEEVGPNGLLELAKVDRMYVAAEVPEIDIPRLRVGQRSTITSDALPGPVYGTVTRVDPSVGRP